jgi:hypothetical protein
MLLPRFSIRTALAILTVVAVISLFAGQALGGQAWAFGLTIAVVSVPLALLVHAGFYGLVMGFAKLLNPEENVVALTSRGGVARTQRAVDADSDNPSQASVEGAAP